MTGNESCRVPDREAIGNLLRLALVTRPDISFAVGLAARSMESPTDTDLLAVKRIFKYLKDTTDDGVLYQPNCRTGEQVYTNADFAG